MKKNQNGFTLIELVMVIVILAILGAVAIPQFVNLQGEAQLANETAVAGGVRAGILTYFIDPARGNQQTYPLFLDPVALNTPCTAAVPCFALILTQGGITDQWQKLNTLTTYRSSVNGTNVWTYTPATGNFQKTTN